jgi:tRNA pseudouridine38-40 synthase
MNAAAGVLRGVHDFSSFISGVAEEPRPKSPVRRMFTARWRRQGEWLHFTCTANAFGRHMVRGIAGTLLRVGQRRLTPEEFAGILEARDRRAAGPNAPGKGLTLQRVDYPRQESLQG